MPLTIAQITAVTYPILREDLRHETRQWIAGAFLRELERTTPDFLRATYSWWASSRGVRAQRRVVFHDGEQRREELLTDGPLLRELQDVEDHQDVALVPTYTLNGVAYRFTHFCASMTAHFSPI